MKTYLSKKERGILLNQLQEKQRQAIFLSIKYTYKSIFGNELAKYKGTKEWEFEGYIDHGKVNANVRCECGKALRYEFVLKNKNNHQTRSLGVIHLQDELELPPSIANAVLSGVQKVDYDLDEILYKIKNGWKIPSYVSINLDSIPYIREDIAVLLKNQLPLLERQVNWLIEQGRIVNLRKMNWEQVNRQFEPAALEHLSKEAISWLTGKGIDHVQKMEERYSSLILSFIEKEQPVSQYEILQHLISQEDVIQDQVNSSSILYTPLQHYMYFKAAMGLFIEVIKQEDHIPIPAYRVNPDYSEERFFEDLVNKKLHHTVLNKLNEFSDLSFRTQYAAYL